MRAHPEFTAGFKAGILSGATPEGVTALIPEEAATRFSVYRNNVMHSLSAALARRFPVIQRLVGEEFFRAMALDFVQRHPPRNPVLIHWGDAFPGFLEAFPPVTHLPYLADVARLELARGRAYHAADATPLQPEAFAALAGGGGLLHLHPSVEVLRLSHPAATIWAANQPGADPHVRASGPEIALVWRRADFEVPVRHLGPPDADFIAGLRNGQSLAELAQTCPDPAAILGLLLSEHLIVKG